MVDWIEDASDGELVEALCEVEEGLTEWETNFADSLSKWSGPLTPKQRATAEKILRRTEGLPPQPNRAEELLKAHRTEKARKARLRANRRRTR